MLDKFEHVKKGHEIDRGGGGNGADDNLNSRAMSADIKRVLEKLGTEDATAALVSGGGGRRAEAERILAEAKHKADATAEDDAGPDKGADKSRLLKAPTNHPLDNVTFKPGSHTWNTDGPSDWRVTHAKAADSEEMKKRDAAMRERFKAVGSHIAYKTNAMRTTGAGSTSFTSTVMGNATVNERVEEVVKRNPPKGKKGVRTAVHQPRGHQRGAALRRGTSDVRELHRVVQGWVLRRRRVPSEHQELHDPGRRSHGHRVRRAVHLGRQVQG
jgi:peptidyl-prolyl cis-trans isomerase-like protein 2